MGKISLGSKSNKEVTAYPGKDRGPSVSYPSFSVNDIKLPLSSKDVGRKIKVQVTLMINKAGAEIDEWGDKRKRFRSSFSVCDIDFGTAKSDIDDDEYAEFMRMSKRGKK